MTLSSYLRGGLFGTFSPSALDTAKSWAADPPMIEEQRGTLVPGMIPRHVAGEQPSTQLAVPGILHDPYMAMARLFDAAGAERAGMPSDDRQNARDAFDVAGLAAMGGFGMPKPANALGIFGGRLAKTADHAKLAQAEEMLARGVPREDVWRETGWFKGVDGKPRFEIDDSKHVVGRPGPRFDKFDDYWHGQSGTGALDSVLRDSTGRPSPYPELGKEKTVITMGGDGGSRIPGLITADAEDAARLRSILLHEKQHGVQDAEGFARGGSSRYFDQRELDAERARLTATSDGDGWTSVGTFDGGTTDKQIGEQLYRRLAGEVEARAVQARRDLTPEQRAARPPWLDYDVPEADQIVRFGNGGPQMSIEPPKPVNSLGSAGGKLRGYHGMDSDAGLDFAKNVRGRFWSSSSPDVASEYAAATDGIAPRVMPVDMDFKNPLVLTSDGAPHWSAIPFEGKRLATDAIADIAVSRGHDGLVLRNIDDVGYGALRGQPHTSYAALQPGTVRSATTGELLFSNPDTAAAFGLLPPPENGRRR